MRVTYKGIDFTAMVDAAIAAKKPPTRRPVTDFERARIRELRLRAGVSRADLARLTRRSTATIHAVLSESE